MLPAPFFNEFPHDLGSDSAWMASGGERESENDGPAFQWSEVLARFFRDLITAGSGRAAAHPPSCR
jgi:hypothetical protein